MATTRDCTTHPVTFSIKDVRRNREMGDFDAYIICPDHTEIYLGSRDSSWDAETLCDTYIYEQLMRRPPLDAAPDAESEPSTSASSLPSASALQARSTALQNCRRFSTPLALTVPRAWGQTHDALPL